MLNSAASSRGDSRCLCRWVYLCCLHGAARAWRLTGCRICCRFHDQDVVVDFAMPPKKEQSSASSADKPSKKNAKESASSPQSILSAVQAPCQSQPSQTKQSKERVSCCFGITSDVEVMSSK